LFVGHTPIPFRDFVVGEKEDLRLLSIQLLFLVEDLFPELLAMATPPSHTSTTVLGENLVVEPATTEVKRTYELGRQQEPMTFPSSASQQYHAGPGVVGNIHTANIGTPQGQKLLLVSAHTISHHSLLLACFCFSHPVIIGFFFFFFFFFFVKGFRV
jgi:hypothetical protein